MLTLPAQLAGGYAEFRSCRSEDLPSDSKPVYRVGHTARASRHQLYPSCDPANGVQFANVGHKYLMTVATQLSLNAMKLLGNGDFVCCIQLATTNEHSLSLAKVYGIFSNSSQQHGDGCRQRKRTGASLSRCGTSRRCCKRRGLRLAIPSMSMSACSKLSQSGTSANSSKNARSDEERISCHPYSPQG